MIGIQRESHAQVRGRNSPNVVYGALVRAIGPKNAEVIDFYVDSRVATEGSGQYEAAMRKLLGEHGGNLVIEAIESELAKLGHHGTKDGVRGLSRGNKRVSPEA